MFYWSIYNQLGAQNVVPQTKTRPVALTALITLIRIIPDRPSIAQDVLYAAAEFGIICERTVPSYVRTAKSVLNIPIGKLLFPSIAESPVHVSLTRL